jgi:hypothetical protein
MNTKTTICGAGLMVVAAIGTAGAAGAPDPNEIFIQRLVYAGSGCPPGSADVALAPDGSGFRLSFGPEFVARLGPGVPLSDSRKNCQVNLQLHVPQGFTFAIAAVDARGRARIADGVTGVQRTTHYFAGEADDTSSAREFPGPFSGEWQTRHVIPLVELVWKPCGVERSLNINAQVRLAADDAPPSLRSFMSMTSERGRLDQLFHFSWRSCP